MKITINHNGFHGHTARTIKVTGKPGERVELTPSQTKKLARAGCGLSECKCGESILDALLRIEGDFYDPIHNPRAYVSVPENGDEIQLTGNYPQR